MKYLSHYTEQATTDLLNETGAFFCFSNEQFDKAKDDTVESYVNMHHGLVCPKPTAIRLYKGLNDINKAGIALDIKENGKKDIIWREFANHECQITWDPEDCIDKLSSYPITEDEIMEQWGPYKQHCIDNDLF